MAIVAATASKTFLYSNRNLLFFPVINSKIAFFTSKTPSLLNHSINKNSITRCVHITPQTLTTHTKSRRSNVVDILQERGLLESITSDSLRSVCSHSNTSPLRVYCGFDPTAESLHLGNLLGIIVLSWFQRCGHKTVALIGGATGRVGDPSGKSQERPELDFNALDNNIKGIRNTITRILGQNSKLDSNFVILNNYDWWREISLLDFLKRVGRYARVGTMMAKESVKKRLESEQGMSYTEFTYQLLQGYDFVYLFENEGVNVQIGGSDQWGNITAGTDLIRRILQAEGAYGLTFPLLLKSDGTKFGKSEDGAIWLSPSMLSPYKFYQYFFSVPDADVVRFLKVLTFLDMEEINEIEKGMKTPAYVPNTAQRRLAEEVTLFVHGKDGLDEALKATEALRPGAETTLDWKTIEGIAEDVPSCSLAYDQVLNLSLVDLSVSAGLLESKSAARRLLKQGGLYVNNKRVDMESKRIDAEDIVDGKVLLLSAGKKNKVVSFQGITKLMRIHKQQLYRLRDMLTFLDTEMVRLDKDVQELEKKTKCWISMTPRKCRIGASSHMPIVLDDDEDDEEEKEKASLSNSTVGSDNNIAILEYGLGASSQKPIALEEEEDEEDKASPPFHTPSGSSPGGPGGDNEVM